MARFLSVLVVGCGAAGAVNAQEASHRRVLILYSFGPNFAPFDEFTSGLRRELTRMSPAPVEFFEASLETARFAETETKTEGPLAAYLSALFQESGIDLVVSIGGPAARFFLSHHGRLFPSTPLLMAGIERRIVTKAPSHGASIAVVVDLPAAIEGILRVLPDTTDIFVVMGGSFQETLWLAEMRREFQPFAGRVRITYHHELSLEELRERVSALPQHTAIFYGLLRVDGSGVPHEHDRALDSLRASANAPLFGLFDTQMGRGIVGGSLLSVSEASRRAAETALRILSGEAPESIVTEPLTAGAPVYDFRELERWGIPEKLLPPGSRVLFRPPSPWERYKGPLSVGLIVVGLETALIASLLLQRSRRRRAEEEAGALSRRLLTAHEDERGRLARELHDDVSQRLARLSMDAAQVERHVKGSSGESIARSIREDSVRLGEDVHALSYRLHPSVLDDLGLREALEAECDRFSRRESIRVELRA